MGLNSTQRRTLGEVIRGFSDSLLEQNLRDHLDKVKKPPELKLPEVIKILKAHPELTLDPKGGFLEGLHANVNIPVPIREAWHQFCEGLNANSPNISQDVLKKLEAYPNYNPFLIAEMRKYEDEVSEIKLAVTEKELADRTKNALLRLREAFLEMTPQHEYSYGQNYRTYYFRIGNFPFNIDQYGEAPQKGEIADYISEIVEDRLELYDQAQDKLKKEQKATQDAKAELEKAKKLQEQVQAQLIQEQKAKQEAQVKGKTISSQGESKTQPISFFSPVGVSPSNAAPQQPNTQLKPSDRKHNPNEYPDVVLPEIEGIQLGKEIDGWIAEYSYRDGDRPHHAVMKQKDGSTKPVIVRQYSFPSSYLADRNKVTHIEAKAGQFCVPILGVSDKNKWIVMEQMHGNLETLFGELEKDKKQLSVLTKLRILYDIARYLQAIQKDPNEIAALHCDLRLNNILLVPNWEAEQKKEFKVDDIAKLPPIAKIGNLDKSTLAWAKERGSYKLGNRSIDDDILDTPPGHVEFALQNKYNKYDPKADIFRFGLLAFEVFGQVVVEPTCRKNRERCEDRMRVVFSRSKPRNCQDLKQAFDSKWMGSPSWGSVPSELFDIVTGEPSEKPQEFTNGCWALDPNGRPTIDKIVQALEVAIKNILVAEQQKNNERQPAAIQLRP